jgi:hypothetical protein
MHALGRQAEFERVLSAAKAEWADWPGGVAWIYAAVGDNETALEWLQRPTEIPSSDRARELEYYVYRDLHDDPRFVAIQEEIGVSPAQLEAINFQPTLPPAVKRN